MAWLCRSIVISVCMTPGTHAAQVGEISRLALRQLLHDNTKQRPALLFGMLEAAPPDSKTRMSQVVLFFTACSDDTWGVCKGIQYAYIACHARQVLLFDHDGVRF